MAACAAICREPRPPFDVPGRPSTWDALHEVTDATLLAEGVLWMPGEPRCANRAFNLVSGDCFRQRDLWPWLAERFGLPAGTVRSLLLARWMADEAPVWERIRARHGLALLLDAVASRDFVLGLDYDLLSSMTAAHAAGTWHRRIVRAGCTMGTWHRSTDQVHASGGGRAGRLPTKTSQEGT